MIIRKVRLEDAEALLSIYAPYVRNTAISFEYEVPTLEEFIGRIKNISSRYPYLVSVGDDGDITGYAYANTFKGRKAYDWSVESTIYVKEDCHGKRIGETLYRELEAQLKDMGILNVNACIAVPKEQDPYLTDGSVRFHKYMGYETVGVFHDSGYKFNRWYDMMWMEKMIGEHLENATPVSFGKF